MAGRRHDDGRVCLCDLPDGTCAGLLVRRLSQDRVWELAEEIWTASSGDVLPARPILDPRSSRAGASAEAAYRQHRDRERAGWRLRFRPSPGVRVWRRQAAMQRRAAEVLTPLGEDGYLVLHDVTLPGWLDSLDHVAVGPTGVWVIESWRHRRLLPGGPPPATVRGLPGPSASPDEVEQATRRLLAVLRPAA
jgi:hypothetical protein